MPAHQLPITLACGAYDRTQALIDGTVRPDGIELSYLPMEPGPLFERMARDREFEAAEMSLATYLNLRGQGDDGLVGLPVFPSRMFRHGDIFVRADGPVRRPEDLRGGRVGLQQYQLTAALWQRGMLADEYGIPASDITWVTGALDEPSHGERAPLHLPPTIRLEPAPSGASLEALLGSGELDAIFTPRIPLSYRRGSGTLRRLFEDRRTIEADYYRRTRLFPIMHLLVIRSDIYEHDPWTAQSLFDAFCAAKGLALARLRSTGTLAAMVPWLIQDLEDAESVFGDSYWPYGLEANRREIATAARYAHEQGIVQRELEVEGLFPQESWAWVEHD